MTLVLISQLIALAALVFSVGALAWRWRWTAHRPFAAVDRAPAKGSPQRGLLYAFTLGMMPWAKESTRRHWIAYVRGIGFHVGIFAGLFALVASPWWPLAPQVIRGLFAALIGLGAVLGLAGNVMRLVEHNLRHISTLDDHTSVLIVSIFLATTSIALLDSAWLPVMYLVGAVMLVYVPLGKIRHCIYFPFSRRFFGLFIGRRAVMHAEGGR